jgi:adenylyltransferase and sulfurtransferase
MGVLQALEAIKILAAGIQLAPPSPDWMTDVVNLDEESPKVNLLMFSAYSHPPFRSVRMRSRRADCAACSSQATITRQSLMSGSLDYTAFCGATNPINILPPSARLTAAEFSRLPTDGSNVLIDVRDETQYAICALRGSINVPWTGSAEGWAEQARANGVLGDSEKDYYLVCRFGNDSQLAAQAAMERAKIPLRIKDIKGGFKAWREEVDGSWPGY